jgi:hypothetical protein
VGIEVRAWIGPCVAILLGLALATPPLPPSVSARPAAGEESYSSLAPASATALPVWISPAAPCGGVYRIDVTTNDSAADSNDGLRMNVSGFLSGSVPANSSLQVSVEETIGSFQAVFGLFENSQLPMTPFYAVYPVGSITPQLLLYWRTILFGPGGVYDFALTHTAGTRWTLALNGLPFVGNSTAASFDFGVGNVTGGASLRFAELAFQPQSSYLPASMLVPLALGVRKNSSWYVPDLGLVTTCGVPSAWGVEGRVQQADLAPGELRSGTQVPGISNGTPAWTEGAVPVRLTIAIAPTTLRATSSADVRVGVTTMRGAPIPGVFLAGHDALGGKLVPAIGETNASGGAEFIFVAPNVTANSSDLVTSLVTLLGYTGFVGQAIALVPAIQFLITADSTTVSVTPGSSTTLSFEVTDLAGHAASGIVVVFSVQVGANLAPGSSVSDASGRVATRLDAPAYATTFLVRAEVGEGGAWGSTTVTVHVSSPTPSIVPLAVAIGGIGVVIAAAFFFGLRSLRRRQKGRLPVPELGLPEFPRARRVTRDEPKPPQP